eukprot:4457871-Karenia_brevis.AAC.1
MNPSLRKGTGDLWAHAHSLKWNKAYKELCVHEGSVFANKPSAWILGDALPGAPAYIHAEHVYSTGWMVAGVLRANDQICLNS